MDLNPAEHVNTDIKVRNATCRSSPVMHIPNEANTPCLPIPNLLADLLICENFGFSMPDKAVHFAHGLPRAPRRTPEGMMRLALAFLLILPAWADSMYSLIPVEGTVTGI